MNLGGGFLKYFLAYGLSLLSSCGTSFILVGQWRDFAAKCVKLT
jgi:hypothetical protein